MPHDTPLASLEYITPKDLANLPLLCSRQNLVRNELSGWLGYDFEKLNIISTYNLIYNAALMVDEGVGYALCLDKLVDTSSLNHLCFKPLNPPLSAGLNIVWKKYQVFSKASEVFLEKITSLCANNTQ